MKTEVKTVSLNVNGKDFSRDFKCPVFESSEDILSYISANDDQSKSALSWINYGADLKLRAATRASLDSEAAGPDRAIAKLVKDLVKARDAVGKPISESDAEVIVKSQLGL